jgi:hypothetical protein
MDEPCPRCGEPTALTSWSMATAETRICDPCSEDEAVRDVKQLPPLPVEDWPVGERLTWADL